MLRVAFRETVEIRCEDPMTPTPPNPGSTLLGCALGFGLSVILIVLLLVAHSTAALLFAGLIQLVYVVPLVMHFRKRGQPNIGTGLIVAASLFLLLTATCGSLLR